MPGRADPGVAVDGAQPYTHDAIALGVAAEQVSTAVRAKRLRLSVGRVPRSDHPRAIEDLKVLGCDLRVQRRGRAAATLAPLTMAVSGGLKRRGYREADRSAQASPFQWRPG